MNSVIYLDYKQAQMISNTSTQWLSKYAPPPCMERLCVRGIQLTNQLHAADFSELLNHKQQKNSGNAVKNFRQHVGSKQFATNFSDENVANT
jgi:hypothetical protein